jgi:hypothetical protein
MRHGLFPKDDISERNSTEPPVICHLRVYALKLLRVYALKLLRVYAY